KSYTLEVVELTTLQGLGTKDSPVRTFLKHFREDPGIHILRCQSNVVTPEEAAPYFHPRDQATGDQVTVIYNDYAELKIPAAYKVLVQVRAENTKRFVLPTVNYSIDNLTEEPAFMLRINEMVQQALHERRSFSGVRTFLKHLESTQVPLLAFHSNVVTPEEAQPYMANTDNPNFLQEAGSLLRSRVTSGPLLR
ncbi:MAG: hypothetical protein Q7R96_06205, partial [Nanoarchaeota archaeon]|nr:hypothetical protein [Nanoarchaeota archaeon]